MKNHTRILYETACGLTIERTLFLPKQEPNLRSPLKFSESP